MTVSEFAALEREIPATDARRLMDAAMAALYPQLKAEDARKLWASWEQAASPHPPVDAGGARFFWNGAVIQPGDLKRKLASTLGSGLIA